MAVNDGVIDGVQAFWREAGNPTLTAVLTFRAGMVDETLPTSGWLHLLEHLAVRGRESPTLSVSASVGLLDTSFEFTGPPQEVVDALAGLTTWLASPDLSHMRDEAAVLHAESEWRGSSSAAITLLERYGARGPGLVGYSEPGLTRVNAPSLKKRASRLLTAGNAVLALSEPPPAGLALHLRGGTAVAPPRAQPTPDKRPAAHASSPGTVLISGVVSRRGHGTILPVLLQRALRERFRQAAGASYAPWATYEPVDAQSAVVIAGTDVRKEALPQASEMMRDAIRQLRDLEWTRNVLSEHSATAHQALSDPRSEQGLPFRAASAFLHDMPPIRDLEDIRREIAARQPAHIATLVDEFTDGLLLGVPDGTPTPKFRSASMPDSEAVRGTGFASRNRPVERPELVVGAKGVSIGHEERHVSVRLGELAGMFTYADGGRVLIRKDGWRIAVEPQLWEQGELAIAKVDAIVPDHLVMPHPARSGDELPKPLTVSQKLHLLKPQLKWFSMLAVLMLALIALSIFIISKDLTRYVSAPMLFAAFVAYQGLKNRPAQSAPSAQYQPRHRPQDPG